jgi:hypothetical protein
LCVEDIGFTSFYVIVYLGYRFYLFLCICVSRISVLPQIHRKRSNRYPQHTNTQKEVKPISSIHKYIERGKTDILNTQIQPLSMYLCVEDIGFTSFYVFVCWGYRFYLVLCIYVLGISALPLFMILNTQIHRKR